MQNPEKFIMNFQIFLDFANWFVLFTKPALKDGSIERVYQYLNVTKLLL